MYEMSTKNTGHLVNASKLACPHQKVQIVIENVGAGHRREDVAGVRRHSYVILVGTLPEERGHVSGFLGGHTALE